MQSYNVFLKCANVFTIIFSGLSHSFKEALTTKEIEAGCAIKVGSNTYGELDKCNWLMENTFYSSSTKKIYGYWTETPYNDNSWSYWAIDGSERSVTLRDACCNHGTRPVIEVLKTDIEY